MLSSHRACCGCCGPQEHPLSAQQAKAKTHRQTIWTRTIIILAVIICCTMLLVSFVSVTMKISVVFNLKIISFIHFKIKKVLCCEEVNIAYPLPRWPHHMTNKQVSLRQKAAQIKWLLGKHHITTKRQSAVKRPLQKCSLCLIYEKCIN